MAYIIKHNENHFLFFLVYILPKTIVKIFKPGDHEPPTNIPLDVTMGSFPPVCLPETNLCAGTAERPPL